MKEYLQCEYLLLLKKNGNLTKGLGYDQGGSRLEGAQGKEAPLEGDKRIGVEDWWEKEEQGADLGNTWQR